MTVDPRSWPFVFLSHAQLGLSGSRPAGYDLVGVLPPRPRLAVVGSRAARRELIELIPRLLAVAKERGWALISGGALGIDGAAHRAALELGQAQLAVLPCGRDRLYPPGHAGLFGRLAASPHAGLLFAQPLGTQTVRAMFASRNALLVALADAVLVVQAATRSGSMVTGRLAASRAVPLAAIAGTAGCTALIGAGARALGSPRQARAEQISAQLGAWLDAPNDRLEQGAGEGSRWPSRLAWLARQLDAAGPAGLPVDALADPERAWVALTEAEALGLVAETAAGRWVSLV